MSYYPSLHGRKVFKDKMALLVLEPINLASSINIPLINFCAGCWPEWSVAQLAGSGSHLASSVECSVNPISRNHPMARWSHSCTPLSGMLSWQSLLIFPPSLHNMIITDQHKSNTLLNVLHPRDQMLCNPRCAACMYYRATTLRFINN